MSDSKWPDMQGRLSDFDIDEVIEHTCWKTDPLVAPFVGGVGTPAERRAAVLAAYRAQDSREENSERQIAFSMKEGPALEKIDEELRRLAADRFAFDPSRTEGQHLIELAQHVSMMAAGWADIIDNDPLEDTPFESDEDQ